MVRGGMFLLSILLSGIEPLSAQYFQKSNPSRSQHSYDVMIGRSWIERIVPGTTFQVQTQNRGGFDVNMFIGYRFTGRLTAGLGWNQRTNVHFRHHFGVSRRRGVFGPRSFVDFKLPLGFSVRGEVETMNAFVPPILGVSPPGAEGSRKWVWGVFAGVKKSFRIKDWLRTNLQLLYNLDDHLYRTSPYSDRLNFRFGVEFYLKKRSKPVNF